MPEPRYTQPRYMEILDPSLRVRNEVMRTELMSDQMRVLLREGALLFTKRTEHPKDHPAALTYGSLLLLKIFESVDKVEYLNAQVRGLGLTEDVPVSVGDYLHDARWDLDTPLTAATPRQLVHEGNGFLLVEKLLADAYVELAQSE